MAWHRNYGSTSSGPFKSGENEGYAKNTKDYNFTKLDETSESQSDSELGEKSGNSKNLYSSGIDNKALDMGDESYEHRARNHSVQTVKKSGIKSADNMAKRAATKMGVTIHEKALHLNLENKCGKYAVGRRISTTDRIAKHAGQCCNGCSLFGWLLNLFPIFTWLSQYNLRDDLISDAVAGFTIAILHIPQGMAYGLLAGVDAINGLYVSFFPVVIYSIMGTSRHISIGTFAVISIMLNSALNKLNQGSPIVMSTFNATGNHSGLIQSNVTPFTPMEALTTICLVTGTIMLVMGFLHLGALSLILSDQIVSAFSCGAAIHVATSQLGSLFDLSLSRIRSGPLKLIKVWINITQKINETNLATLVVSLAAIGILVVTKECLEPRLKRRVKMSIPLPIDFIVIATVTAISYLANLHSTYNVKVMGMIPVGLPNPAVPRLDLILSVIPSCFAIAVVSFTVSLSMAKIFAKKHKYRVNPNQELIALGSANVLSSFFSCYPCSASLSRSLVQETAGAKSQLAGIISSAIILVVLLFLGPLLYHLPKCILACVILVALKGMFLQIGDLYYMWKVSRSEGLTWLITFLSVVLLDIDSGLVVGVCFSILMVLVGFITPHSSLLGVLPRTEIYVDIKYFPEARELPGVKIFQYSSALFFLNRDHFKETLFRTTLNTSSDDLMSSNLKLNANNVRTVIIDCSPISYIDSSGVETILDVVEALHNLSIRCHLCCCATNVLSMFERTSFFEKISQISCRVFPSIQDAVVNCTTFTVESH